MSDTVASGQHKSIDKRPPLVKGLPLLGSALPLMKDPHGFCQQAYQDYGDIFRFKAAHKEMIIMAGQDANRFVSGEGRKILGVEGFWGEAFEYLGCPHGLVGVDGEMHAFQRKLMTPIFQASAWTDKIPNLAEPITDLITSNTGKVVTVGDVLRQMISNQIGYNLQGHKTSYKKVQQMIYYFGATMNVFVFGKWPKFFLYTPKFQVAKRVSRKNAIKTVEQAEKRTPAEIEENPQYLDVILPAMKERPDWFSEGDIGAHAMLPFIAALDTVASTMGFVLYRLLQDPALKKRIVSEVDHVFSTGLPNMKTLRGMKGLNGLVKETMRVQPTAFGITRTATSDFVFKGYKVHKGEDVIVFTTADHMNPDYFPNPEKFDIDRISSDRNEFRQPAFAPFGKGPHACLGASLSEIMMPLNIGLILYNLEFKAACDLDRPSRPKHAKCIKDGCSLDFMGLLEVVSK